MGIITATAAVGGRHGFIGGITQWSPAYVGSGS